MKITRRKDILVVEDDLAAFYGVGVLVPAILVGIFFVLILPRAAEMRFEIAGIMSVATAVVLALFKAPRRTEFDQEHQEARMTIGWPPLGRRRVIPFADIAEAKVWRLIQLNDLGRARPALVLRSGETVFLSTYDRSPRECREIVSTLEQTLPHQASGSPPGLET